MPYLTFNGTTTSVSFGSAASLDDLHDGILCVEGWFLATSAAQLANTIINKHDGGTAGWTFYLTQTNGFPTLSVRAATTNSNIIVSANYADSVWHHFVAFFNDGEDRKSRIALDGTWSSFAGAAVGLVGSDAALNLVAGRRSTGENVWTFAGQMGWMRISNNDRYDGTNGTSFTPPARDAYPADDANTISLWYTDEGTGVTLTDQNANGNDGTITDGTWA